MKGLNDLYKTTDKHREYMKAYRKRNRESLNTYQRAYMKEYRKRNRESINAYYRAYMKECKECNKAPEEES